MNCDDDGRCIIDGGARSRFSGIVALLNGSGGAHDSTTSHVWPCSARGCQRLRGGTTAYPPPPPRSLRHRRRQQKSGGRPCACVRRCRRVSLPLPRALRTLILGCDGRPRRFYGLRTYLTKILHAAARLSPSVVEPLPAGHLAHGGRLASQPPPVTKNILQYHAFFARNVLFVYHIVFYPMYITEFWRLNVFIIIFFLFFFLILSVCLCVFLSGDCVNTAAYSPPASACLFAANDGNVLHP